MFAYNVNTMRSSTLLFLVMLMAPLVGAGIDSYTPSMPYIAQHFHASNIAVRFTLIMYLLGYALGQIFFGPISDRHGRRNTVIIGLIIYITSSLLAAVSPNMFCLLSTRLLQGFAIGSVAVIMKSVLSDRFEGPELARGVAYMTTAWSVGPIVAPAIGGYIQHYFGWRYNFLFLMLYGLTAFALIFFFLAETNKHKIPLDQKHIYHNFRKIVSHKILMCAIFCVGIAYSMLMVFNTMAPFLIQITLKFTAVDYGHIALFMGVGYFIGTFTNRLIVNKFTSTQIILSSLALMICGAIAMVTCALLHLLNIWVVTAPVFVIFFGAAFILPNCMTLALQIFPRMGGASSAMNGFLTMLTVSVITSLVSLFDAKTLMPIALCYLALIGLCIFIYSFILFARKRT